MHTQLRLLPPVGGAREAYIGQLLRMVKLKALALTKYVDAEPLVQQGDFFQWGWRCVNVLGAMPPRGSSL